MKFGIRYCNTGRYVDPVQAIELVQAAEAAGFESAWTVEHTIIPRSYDSPYPYTQDGKIPGIREDTSLPDPQIWLAYVAARTTRINLATGILILPQHNPVICAKQVATLDHISGGRVILGIGVGWLKEEFDALGVPFEERGARTDDYIGALRTLWAEEVAIYQGKYVSFHAVYMRPKPVRREVPIIIGGDSKPAASRAGRLGNGYFPGRGASLDLIAQVRRAAVKAGRDPASIEITASMPDDPAILPDLAAAGISRVLVPVSTVGLKQRVNGPEDLARWRDIIDRHAELTPTR
jgi:probable F420-dependent oxidoreductase